MIPINYLAVLAAALGSMVVGSLWYSPMLFAKQWMHLVGKKKEDAKNFKTGMIFAIVASLIMAYVLAHFVYYMQATTVMDALTLGLWTWLGFVATTTGVNYIFAGRPGKLYAIDAGYHLAVLIVMSIILTLWK